MRTLREPDLTLYWHRPTYVDELPALSRGVTLLRLYGTLKLIDKNSFEDPLPRQFSQRCLYWLSDDDVNGLMTHYKGRPRWMSKA